MNDEKQLPTVEYHTAEKLNHEDQEMEASTTSDAAGRCSHEQFDHSNLKTRDGGLQHDDSDGADDAGGTVGGSVSGAKQHLFENFLKGDSKFSANVFSPMKTLDHSLLEKVKTYSSLTSHHSSNRIS